MDNDPVNRCETKVMYDSEFQAIVVAARRSADWGADIIPYPCGRHWHIANADPTKRNKHTRPPQHHWCEACQVPMNPKRWKRHILFKRHIKLQKKLDEGA